MTLPLVTVIIPIYGTENYLRSCLDSVINQTFKDIEIICVDDCSPDNSYKIVEEYQAKDSRISLIRHEKNLGQGGARNTAIVAAKADYIASVDSDDSMQPKMLEKLWEASNNGEFDIVCCGYSRVNEEGAVLAKKIYKSSTLNSSQENINIFTLLNPAIWNKLWRKSLFLDNDIFYPNNLYYQDMATTPLLLAKAEKIRFIDDCLYNYLVRENSVTTSFSPKHIIDYFKVYEMLYEFIERNGLNDRHLKNYNAYVIEGMRFHSNNVLNSALNEDEKKQYLRHLLMMKESFIKHHHVLKTKTSEELRLLLLNTSSNNQVDQPSKKGFIRVAGKFLGLIND